MEYAGEVYEWADIEEKLVRHQWADDPGGVDTAIELLKENVSYYFGIPRHRVVLEDGRGVVATDADLGGVLRSPRPSLSVRELPGGPPGGAPRPGPGADEGPAGLDHIEFMTCLEGDSSSSASAASAASPTRSSPAALASKRAAVAAEAAPPRGRRLVVEHGGRAYEWVDADMLHLLLSRGDLEAAAEVLRENILLYFGIPWEAQVLQDAAGRTSSGAELARVLQSPSPFLRVLDGRLPGQGAPPPCGRASHGAERGVADDAEPGPEVAAPWARWSGPPGPGPAPARPARPPGWGGPPGPGPAELQALASSVVSAMAENRRSTERALAAGPGGGPPPPSEPRPGGPAPAAAQGRLSRERAVHRSPIPMRTAGRIPMRTAGCAPEPRYLARWRSRERPVWA